MEIFAAGNKYKVKTIKWNEEKQYYEVFGYKWIKSKQKYSKVNYTFRIEHYEEIKAD